MAGVTEYYLQIATLLHFDEFYYFQTYAGLFFTNTPSNIILFCLKMVSIPFQSCLIVILAQCVYTKLLLEFNTMDRHPTIK